MLSGCSWKLGLPACRLDGNWVHKLCCVLDLFGALAVTWHSRAACWDIQVISRSSIMSCAPTRGRDLETTRLPQKAGGHAVGVIRPQKAGGEALGAVRRQTRIVLGCRRGGCVSHLAEAIKSRLPRCVPARRHQTCWCAVEQWGWHIHGLPVDATWAASSSSSMSSRPPPLPFDCGGPG